MKFKCIFFILILLIVSGCSHDGNSRASNEIVKYENTDLYVRGEVYSRQAGIEKGDDIVIHGSLEYAPGQVIILFENGKIDQVISLLDSFELALEKETSLGKKTMYIISVPDLFEEQWVAALGKETCLLSAEINRIVHIN